MLFTKARAGIADVRIAPIQVEDVLTQADLHDAMKHHTEELGRNVLELKVEIAAVRRAQFEAARKADQMARAIGRLEQRSTTNVALEHAGFQVYSQSTEDGALAWLAAHVEVPNKTFVELGMEDYQEATTRFLLTDCGWRGFVVDSNADNIERLRASELYWQRDITSTAVHITCDNVDELLTQHGFTGPIGLLSIDIDGNDYWIWEQLCAVQPAIVCIEYNWRFGSSESVTVPYDAQFDRRVAHESWLWFGASLHALVSLGHTLGYALIGVSPSAVNAYFVRRELLNDSVKERAVTDVWVEPSYHERRSADGGLVWGPFAEESAIARSQPLVDVPPGVFPFRSAEKSFAPNENNGL